MRFNSEKKESKDGEDSDFKTMLVEQYRMNELIMNWSSNMLYHDRLVAHPSVAERQVDQLLEERTKEGSSKGEESKIDANEAENGFGGPLMMIDTAGSLMHEQVEEDKAGLKESKYNLGETDLVIATLKELFEIGLKEEDIGVITPYSAQVSEIRKEIKRREIRAPGISQNELL